MREVPDTTTVELEVPEQALRAIGWKEGERVRFERLSPITWRLQNWNDPSREVIVINVLGVPID